MTCSWHEGTPQQWRRGSGNVFTHILMAVLGAALAIGLLLSFDNQAPGSLPGSGTVPSPGISAARCPAASRPSPPTSSRGLVIINTTQAQQEQQQEQNGGFGSGRACYTSNADVTVPSAIAPASSGTLVLGTICGSPAAQARHDRRGDAAAAAGR
jgi:hypothetical protein